MTRRLVAVVRPLAARLTDAAWTAALFVFSVVMGFALLTIMFKLHLLGGMDILFYRGLVLIGIVGCLTFGVLMVMGRAFHATPNLAFTATVVSMSFNLNFLVLLPVTIDRSTSIFLLGYMAQRPEASFSSMELRDAYSEDYLVRFRQIERRMHEQIVSRNIEQVGDRYRISAQGRTFVRFAQDIAWLFDTDPRFINSNDAAMK